MSVAIIINPVSGASNPEQARRCAEAAARVLSQAGEEGQTFVTERRGHARELAAASVGRGARLVLAWGGDGTVNEVGAALAFGPAALGVVPSGSGNGLARALGVAMRPEQAIMDALRATPIRIDVGEIGGRLFVNVGGVGFDAHVASCFDRGAGVQRGWPAYARITAWALLTYRPQTYRITGDGFEMACRALLVALANSPQYGNSAQIAPGARVDDGRLDLVAVEERSRVRTLCAVPRLFTGTIARVPGVRIRQVEQAVIESGEPMIFHVDGEAVQGGTRLAARIHPRALNVCVK
jgi:YegS/Rv2252/BmrU family lipid kinase